MFWRGRSGKILADRHGHLVRCKTCPCCKCEPFVLASYITNPPEDKTWDLTPYQGPGVVKWMGICPVTSVKRRWRLRERAYGLQYGEGEVSSEGELIGLPNSFTSSYSYPGYMELQIACKDKIDGGWIWP